jgi:threonine aldolase
MLICDLRSDTVTRPSPEMREAMMSAPLGDDVFGEDPTVNELETHATQLFGKEAALFCPSGTMTNQIAVKVLTQPLDEVILDKNAHIYLYEGGGPAFNSGVSLRLLDGDRGRITAEQVRVAINPDNVHHPVTRVVALENTANRGGGAIYDFAEIQRISAVCKENQLALHLDGARLFNALAETSQTPADYGKVFDTLSICLSKGLGAPVGSLLLGTQEKIKYARRVRKVLGGGMRQAGILAAAGLYALKYNVQRIKEDHRKAKALATDLATLPYVAELLPVETNILVFRLRDEVVPAQYLEWLKSQGVLAVSFGGQWVRFVTHLDVTDDHLCRVREVIPAFSWK